MEYSRRNIEKICVFVKYPFELHLTGLQRVYELNALLLLLSLKKTCARCRKSFKRKEGRKAVYISMHTYSREFNSNISRKSLIAFCTLFVTHKIKIISAFKLFTKSYLLVPVIVAASAAAATVV